MTDPKPKRGGKRAGSGRKPGRVAVSATITLPGPLWALLDEKRGSLTRSAWVASKIQEEE